MPMPFYGAARALLFQLDAELAHNATLAMLERAHGTPLARLWQQERVADPVTLAGLTFPNRVGLAAGLDKNARAIGALEAIGFGFAELGTVTPLAQPGNPRPRLFRLPAAEAIVNRMGFNNDGLEAFTARVRQQRQRWQAQAGGAPHMAHMLLGLNIGKNAATPIERAADDYLKGLAAVYPLADYIAINISSPNTKNLRDLQSEDALNALLATLAARKKELADEHADTHPNPVPLFLKIAPDLDEPGLQSIAAALLRHGIDGVIATNTTISREAVKGLPHAEETGGLSGRPLRALSTSIIAKLRAALGADFPIIGAGGIFSAQDALEKIQAGANAVQIYTGFIYKGPALVPEIARAIKEEATRAT